MFLQSLTTAFSSCVTVTLQEMVELGFKVKDP